MFTRSFSGVVARTQAAMNVRYSYGRDARDNNPTCREAPDFEDFVAQILALPRPRSKETRTYICGPMRPNGDGRGHRGKADLLPRSWLALDLDGGSREDCDVMLLRLADHQAVAWTTARHTPECPRLRILMALDRAVDGSEGERLGPAVAGVVGSMLPSLKWDPSTYKGEQECFVPMAGAEIMRYRGDPMDVDAILALAPPSPRQRPSPGSDPYRNLLEAHGLVLREIGPGKDAITCPFAAEHSEQTSDSSTAYFRPLHNGHKWGRIHCLHAHCRDREQEDYIRALGAEPRDVWRGQAAEGAPVDENGSAADEAEDATGDAPTAGARATQIILRAGELTRIVANAIAALRGAGAPIYDRGGALYRPVHIEAPSTSDGVRRPAGALVLRLVDAIWVRVNLAAAAEWQKWNPRDEEMRPADPPRDIGEIIATQSDLANWPVLRGVVSHPVVTPEGRVISTPGYDRDTGLLIEITGSWPIPVAPTRDDSVGACARLTELLRHYPWVSEVDRAVGLSLLLTAIARPVLPAAPMHCVDSPEAGSGKSLLVDAAAILASGGPASVMDFGRDAVEAGKRLDAMMLAGDSLIAIDNVELPLEGAVLCQALTQTTRRIRVLGGHTVVTIPCVQLITATGCNLTLRGDIVRRAIICRLDAKTDRPELRVIDQDLLAEVREMRREIVGDLITMMLAYQRAGHPHTGVSPLGGFGAWSRMVRHALIWAGEADPCGSMDQIRGNDPSRQNLALVLGAWHAAFGKDAATSAEAVARAEDDAGLREALAVVCEKRGVLDTRVLGYWLRGHRDRRSGELVLRAGQGDGHRKVARWVVTAGDGGVCG